MANEKHDKVVEYLNNNVEKLLSIVTDINSYNGSMEEYEYLDMADFNEIMSGKEPIEIAQDVAYGDGFNPQDDYFVFDGYGHIKSLSEFEANGELADNISDIADNLIDIPTSNLSLPSELADIINSDDSKEE